MTRQAPPARHVRAQGRADSRHNRAAILDAAAALVSATGTVTVAGVAARAGLTRATVYRHFADHDALVDGLVGHLAGPSLERVLDGVDEGPLDQAVARLARRVAAVAAEHRALLLVVAPRLQQLAREVVDDEPLTAALRRRRAAGELTAPEGDAWLASCVRALCLAAVADERPVDEVGDDLAATLQRLLR